MRWSKDSGATVYADVIKRIIGLADNDCEWIYFFKNCEEWTLVSVTESCTINKSSYIYEACVIFTSPCKKLSYTVEAVVGWDLDYSECKDDGYYLISCELKKKVVPKEDKCCRKWNIINDKY